MSNFLNFCAAVSGGSPYHLKTQAYLAQLTGPLPVGYAAVVDTYVRAMILAGAFDTDDVHYLLANFSEQATKINLISPGNNTLTVPASHTAPTFSAKNGVTGNGVYDGTTPNGARVLTVPTALSSLTLYTQNSASVGIYSKTTGQSINVDVGALGAGTMNITCRNTSNAAIFRVNGANTLTYSSITDGSGYYVGIRNNSANIIGYKNGTAMGAAGGGTSAARSAGLPSSNGYSEAGPLYQSNERQLSLLHLGAALSAQQISDRNTAFGAYLTALSALTV